MRSQKVKKGKGPPLPFSTKKFFVRILMLIDRSRYEELKNINIIRFGLIYQEIRNFKNFDISKKYIYIVKIISNIRQLVLPFVNASDFYKNTKK